jgi:polyisoprenoid-binding protein YceI
MTPVTLAAPVSAPGTTETWTIDPSHASVGFAVRHLMISTVRGSFAGVTGTALYDPKNPAASKVEASINCSTVTTGVAKRDAQMKGPDFFDTAKYPSMKFVSKRVEPAGDGKLKITGDLTINATTRAVVLDVDGPSAVVRDAQGRDKIGLNATTKINRKEYGLHWNSALETGGILVGEEVTLTLDVQFIKG